MHHQSSQLDAVEWLRGEFHRRRQKNAYYSLRSFARALDMPAGRLSEIFSRKRALSPGLAKLISARLCLLPQDEEKFLAAIKPKSKTTVKVHPKDEKYLEIKADCFSVIADWQHYAILSLMETDDFKSSNLWIAKRLGVSSSEVQSALERLIRLGFVEKKRGKLALKQTQMTVGNETPMAALRLSHRQSLQQAIEALDHVPLDKRDVTSITMAIDVAKIAKAKALIKRFRRSLSSMLETDSKTEVYNLNVQLVPVTKSRTGEW